MLLEQRKNLSKFGGQDLPYTADMVADFLSSRCEPWMKHARGKNNFFLHRFGYNAIPRFAIKQLASRTPRDTASAYHRLMNRLIKYADKTANRQNSIICNPDTGADAEYGNYHYVLIPIGNFNYTWSPQMKDWYLGLESEAAKLFLKYKLWRMYKVPDGGDENPEPREMITRFESGIQDLHSSEQRDAVNQFLNKYVDATKINLTYAKTFANEIIKGDDNSLDDAVLNYPNNEIMIRCEAAACIDWTFFWTRVMPSLDPSVKTIPYRPGHNDGDEY